MMHMILKDPLCHALTRMWLEKNNDPCIWNYGTHCPCSTHACHHCTQPVAKFGESLNPWNPIDREFSGLYMVLPGRSVLGWKSFGGVTDTQRACSNRTFTICCFMLGRHVCRTKLPPKSLLNRYEKRFEKREKGSEKRSETRLNNF